MRKRNFLLIELMIAVGLVAALTVPVLSLPSYVAKSEISELYAMECQRHADLVFLRIAKALDEKHPWKTLPKRLIDCKKQFLDPEVIDVPGFGKQTLEVVYKIWRMKPKISTEDNNMYSIVKCRIWFPTRDKDFHYNYKVLVRNSEHEYTAEYHEDEDDVDEEELL